jgi:hypothetical protein
MSKPNATTFPDWSRRSEDTGSLTIAEIVAAVPRRREALDQRDMVATEATPGRFLPAEVREGSVSLGHLVHVVALLDRAALPGSSVS